MTNQENKITKEILGKIELLKKLSQSKPFTDDYLNNINDLLGSLNVVLIMERDMNTAENDKDYNTQNSIKKSTKLSAIEEIIKL